MSNLDDLRLRQLDETLARFQALRKTQIPKQGWARTVRQALGMSLRQLAERTGISKTAVTSAESFEAKGSVRLDSLRTLADGLGCELVYAIVPRTSLKNAVEEQALAAARNAVERVSRSMELELQGVDEDERRRQVAELAEELLRTRGREFWDG